MILILILLINARTKKHPKIHNLCEIVECR
jgi:hypothetical protein